MQEDTERENRALIDFWDKAFTMPEKMPDPESWKNMAPSTKLFEAASSFGKRNKVLDYGCGTAWAGIIAAKCGCPDVIAIDPAFGAVQAARHYAKAYGVEENVHIQQAGLDWLRETPEKTFDGLFCSNVLDVVPTETAKKIIHALARIATGEASIVIGLNFYLSKDEANRKGIRLVDGKRVYMDGILRLVSRKDEEWMSLFSPWLVLEKLVYFAWPGEARETRRLFYLKKKQKASL